MAVDAVSESAEKTEEQVKAEKNIANLTWNAANAGFEKRQNTESMTSRVFDDRRSKTLENGTELHIQISTAQSEKKEHINVYGWTHEVAANFWVVKKDGKGSGTSMCYTMDKNGHWYLQSFRGYKSLGNNDELWSSDGGITAVSEKAVKEAVFDRIRKSGLNVQEQEAETTEQIQAPPKKETLKVEYKPRTWNDTKYVEDELRDAGKFKLIRADIDLDKRDDIRDKQFARRFRGLTTDGSVVEMQTLDGTEQEESRISFNKDGSKIENAKVIMKVWVLEKPKNKVFDSETNTWKDQFEQRAVCYMLTEKDGWYTTYGTRREGTPLNYLDYNKDVEVDKITRANSVENKIWNIYQSSTVDPEPLLQKLRERLKAQ